MSVLNAIQRSRPTRLTSRNAEGLFASFVRPAVESHAEGSCGLNIPYAIAAIDPSFELGNGCMPPHEPANLTQVLDAAIGGDKQAAEDLLPILYGELKRLAHSYMNRQSDGQTLQTTALVHEAYMRLVGQQDPGWHLYEVKSQGTLSVNASSMLVFRGALFVCACTFAIRRVRVRPGVPVVRPASIVARLVIDLRQSGDQ